MIKKILTISIVIATILATLVACGVKTIGTSSRVNKGKVVKVGVLVNRVDIDFMPSVLQNLERIQKKNPGKVEFYFYDAKQNQATQDDDIDKLLKEGVDLLLLSITDITASQRVVNKIKEFNIPVVLFNREPDSTDVIKSYEKAFYIGSDSKEAGTIQGEILVNAWTARKSLIDRNGDNIMQYIMLQGDKNNLETLGRTKYSVLEINNSGIKTEELAVRTSNWDKQLAKDTIQGLFFRYGNRVEVIIANNDGMAVGAIEALQMYGYNKGDKEKTIPVVGVDATPEAQELIKKGFMEGSVIQDPKAMAEALYIVGMNLVFGNKPLHGTQYKLDDTGVSIRIPHRKYTNN